MEPLKLSVYHASAITFQADAKTVFDADPDSLWPQMIKKTNLEFAVGEPSEVDQQATQNVSSCEKKTGAQERRTTPTVGPRKQAPTE
jgi:hypothetical protein